MTRLRSIAYLRHVRGKPCLYCGAPGEAHHITYAQPRAMAMKTGDDWVVPLCHLHHMDLHNSPMPEKTWWALIGVNPMAWAANSFKEWDNGHNH